MTFDDAARARIAKGWLNSSLDQPTYAAKNGISTRTLRQWVARYGAGRRPAAHARAIIESAIAQLQALRTALDAEEAGLIGAADDLVAQAEHDDEELHAAAAEPASAAPPTPAASQARRADAAVPDQALDAEEACHSGVPAAAPVDRIDRAADVAPRRLELPPEGPSEAKRSSLGVLDLERFRMLARAARAATGAPNRPLFNWDVD